MPQLYTPKIRTLLQKRRTRNSPGIRIFWKRFDKYFTVGTNLPVQMPHCTEKLSKSSLQGSSTNYRKVIQDKFRWYLRDYVTLQTKSDVECLHETDRHEKCSTIIPVWTHTGRSSDRFPYILHKTGSNIHLKKDNSHTRMTRFPITWEKLPVPNWLKPIWTGWCEFPNRPHVIWTTLRSHVITTHIDVLIKCSSRSLYSGHFFSSSSPQSFIGWPRIWIPWNKAMSQWGQNKEAFKHPGLYLTLGLTTWANAPPGNRALLELTDAWIRVTRRLSSYTVLIIKQISLTEWMIKWRRRVLRCAFFFFRFFNLKKSS